MLRLTRSLFHWPSAISLCLVLTVGLWGCVLPPDERTLPPWTPPPSEQVRQEIRIIGVVAAEFVPEQEFYVALRGRAKTAAKGAGTGALQGSKEAVEEYMRRGPLAGLTALIIAVPLGSLIGGIAGAVEAVPESTAQSIEAQIIDGLSNPEMQMVVRDRIAEEIREETRYKVVVLENSGPRTPGASVTYDPFSTQGIDAVLEASVLTVGLAGYKRGEWPYKKLTLHLYMIARARLFETHGNTVIHEDTVHFIGGPREFTKWGGNNGKGVQKELDRAYQHLAEQIVEEAFIIWWPTPSESN